MSITLWHNPRCSTSRKALEMLQDKGVEPTLRLYLEDAPSLEELKAVSAQLPGGAQSLVRWKEPEAAALKGAGDDALLAALAANPRLIERPVAIGNGMARVGRPAETVLETL
ncbi:ArsC/Spx/MgsR family protein [Pedomonas mirosovicensis]|uniref:ArsC/Spx/MgsR family protein n=1 Tax=Pedomonas mirosovicensis TaxID=2908641 RepID=UPI002169B1BE|nr:ArsC/Spx/MgsR family protein [Pedomonas mirosovicensis]MCH8684080.1 arsenate reductase (glutaredoxin) [Pedomonas mirosovicensis]